MLIRRRGSAQSPRDVGNRQDLNQTSISTNSTGSKVLLTPALNLVSETSSSVPILLFASSTPSDTTITLTSSLPLSSIVPSSATIIQPPPASTEVSSSLSSSLSSSSLSSSSLSSSSSSSSLPHSSPSSSPPLPSSRSSSISSTSPTPATITASSSIASSSSVFSSTEPPVPVFDSPSASGVTSFITTTSGTVPTTVITIVAASASSIPSQPSSSTSFLQNKAQSGAVFGVVALVALAGIGFLTSRLYRVMKKRKTDRETEDAAREAAMVKVRLDDDDDDQYGRPANPFSMMEYPSKPPMVIGGFDTHANGGLGMGDFDEGPSAIGMNPFLDNFSLHHQPIQHPPPYNSTRDAFDIAERGHSNNVSPRISTSSKDPLVGGFHAPTEPLSKQQSRGSTNTVWSSPSAPETQTQSTRLPSQSSLPATLPEAFGDGETARSDPRVTAKSFKDYEDYQHNIARVLKIANE